MKFKYIKAPLKQKSPIFGSHILKPIIPIELKHKEIHTRYAILIDSGADFCIFDAWLAEYLGIKLENSKFVIFSGVSGSPAKAFFAPVEINVGGWKFKAEVSFSYEISPRGYGILGQKGFFEYFTVKFDLKKEEIELKPKK